MSEGEVAMDMDNSDLSMYQMEVPGLCGKPGFEIPAPVSEEVVISDSSVASEPPAPGVPVLQETSTVQILEDQRVEEFVVEIQLDQDEDDCSRDSVHQPEEPIYTMLEHAPKCGSWTSQLFPTSASGDGESVDSGLGSSERSSILSKKNSFSRLPSQGKPSNKLISFDFNYPEITFPLKTRQNSLKFHLFFVKQLFEF